MKFRIMGVILGLLLAVGCAKVSSDGPYQGDNVLFVADQTIVEGYDAIHAFVTWEHANREILKDNPDVTKAADKIRANAQRLIKSTIAMRDAYANAPNTDNRKALNAAIAMLRQATIEALSYSTNPPKKG